MLGDRRSRPGCGACGVVASGWSRRLRGSWIAARARTKGAFGASEHRVRCERATFLEVLKMDVLGNGLTSMI